LREVTARYEEAAKAREQKKKVDDLKKELAWSHVAAKEAEMVKAVQDAAKLARRLPRIEESVQKAEVRCFPLSYVNEINVCDPSCRLILTPQLRWSPS
jgi:chromosome segregation ATPase